MPGLYFGTDEITSENAFLGNTQLCQIYRGNTLVWPLESTPSFSFPLGYSWSTLNSLPTGVNDAAGGGTSPSNTWVASGICSPSPSTWCTLATQEFNGTSWATGGNVTRGNCGGDGVGSQNAALMEEGAFRVTSPVNGIPPAVPSNEGFCCQTVEYNGTAWSNGGLNGTAPTVNGTHYMRTLGTQNSAFCFGGYRNYPPTPSPGWCSNQGKAALYNGTTWSAETTMPNTYGPNPPAFCNAGWGWQGAGCVNAALAAGDQAASTAPGRLSTTYDGTAWSTGPNTPTRIDTGKGGAGTSNAAVLTGRSCVVEFDGTSWHAGTSRVVTPFRAERNTFSGGTNSGIAAGGSVAGTSFSTCVEQYS